MAAANPARIAPSGPTAGGFTSITKFENVAIPDTVIASSQALVISVPVPGAKVGDMVILSGITTDFPGALILGSAFEVATEGFIKVQIGNLSGGNTPTGTARLSGALVRFRD